MTTPDDAAQPRTRTLRGADHYPDHVKAVLEVLRAAEEEVQRAKEVHDAAVAKRNTVLRENYPMLKRNKVGPAAIERATKVGRSNVRFVTSGSKEGTTP